MSFHYSFNSYQVFQQFSAETYRDDYFSTVMFHCLVDAVRVESLTRSTAHIILRTVEQCEKDSTVHKRFPLFVAPSDIFLDPFKSFSHILRSEKRLSHFNFCINSFFLQPSWDGTRANRKIFFVYKLLTTFESSSGSSCDRARTIALSSCSVVFLRRPARAFGLFVISPVSMYNFTKRWT